MKFLSSLFLALFACSILVAAPQGECNPKDGECGAVAVTDKQAGCPCDKPKDKPKNCEKLTTDLKVEAAVEKAS